MAAVAVTSLKAMACNQIDALASDLIGLSHAIHKHAEPAFAEHHSAEALSGFLTSHGMRVRRAVGGLATAFTATSAHSGPLAAIFCEYDALPGAGHACGHNIIAAAGAGAAAALHHLGVSVRLIGSPAEEHGGGKILLARAGVLNGVSAAMLVHPNAYETARPRIIAALPVDVTTLGRAAHATLYPERGINALDAIIFGYLAATSMRASLPPAAHINGVLINGGHSPGVIPDRAQASFLLRAATLTGLTGVATRFATAFSGAAASVGARTHIRATGPAYAHLRTNPALASAWERNIRQLGRRPMPTVPVNRVGSSDMGNISHLVPTIHPMIAISNDEPVPHTPKFAAAAISPRGDQAVIDGAKALAMTAIDVWSQALTP